jgi:tRNA threonylcarbamoyladenosine biosynthesis protein TsaB
MILLALDTASAAVSVAVHDGHEVLADRSSDPVPRHAELLAPLIRDVLADAGIGTAALTAVVVGVGPGPFTGLRVGLVTARMFGLALGVPVHGVCSLDAVAAGALRLGSLGTAAGGSLAEKEFVVATDARRRELYWARYVVVPDDVQGWRRLDGPNVSAPDDVARCRLPVVGRGGLLYPHVLPGDGLPGGSPDDVAPLRPLDPVAADLADVAARELHRASVGAAEPADAVLLPPEPLYLRRPDAQKPGERKRVLR